MGADPEKLAVATDALRADAGLWDDKSAEISQIGTTVKTLTFSHLEAGLFFTITSANDKLVEDVVGRSGEAAQRFTEVASVLRLCADTYEAEEVAGMHRFDNIW